MIALTKEIFEIIKKEFQYIGLLFLSALVVLKIVFFKEDFIVIARTALSLFWLFVLPGYFVMLYWREKLDFTERLIVGIALSAAIIGISSYYFGLIGANIKYHTIFLPLALIIIGIVKNFKNRQTFPD